MDGKGCPERNGAGKVWTEKAGRANGAGNMRGTETITIDSLAYGGYGVGRINSKVVFINYSVPGDILKIEIFAERKHYAFGRIAEIIAPSPDRIVPACRHFGICGGCDYLNLPYEKEIYWKTEIFKTGFIKILGNDIDIKRVNLIPDFENKNCLNYRQKIGLKIYPPHIGFYKKSTHRVIDVEYCRLAKESVNALLKNARNLLLDKDYENAILNRLETLTLTDAGLKNIIFGFKSGANFGKGGIPKFFAEDAANKTGADNVFFEFPDKKTVKFSGGKGGIVKEFSRRENNGGNNGAGGYFILKDKKFSYDLPSFIQVNKEQNEKIISVITDYIEKFSKNPKKIKFDNALDLYCGFGNITLFLSHYAEAVTGVESDAFSVELGEKNAGLNRIENVKFVKSDAGNFLENANCRNELYDLVVLDPPRAGVKGLAPKIAGLGPSSVIYVSCDTMTLLRDLKVFAEMGYRINQINLIDMFPRTYHMEHIAFLSK